MDSQKQYQRPDRFRTAPLQVAPRFAGLYIGDVYRNLPLAYRPNVPPYIAPLSAEPGTLSLPAGWARHIDYETGRFYYKRDTSFSPASDALISENRSNVRGLPRLDLKLNLSPSLLPLLPANSQIPVCPMQPDSCMSSEFEEPANQQVVRRYGGSNAPPMVLKGCPHCLLYVMLNEDQEPNCPKCLSPGLVDFLNEHSKDDDDNNTTTNTTTTNKNNKRMRKN